MLSLLQDLKYGMRMLAKNPGFTVVAALTLALGIGPNTAIFSMVNALLFRPLPVRHPEEIYTLSAAGAGNTFSYQDFEDIRKQTSSVFSDMAGVQILSTTGLNVSGKSERMWTEFVTGNFFEMLGIRPALGRFIFPSEGHVAGADPVLVLGYSFWKAHLGADPNIVGKKASVNGQPVRSLEPNMPLADVQTMRDALDAPNGLLVFKLAAGLAVAIGILGLILAVIGVYSVVSYMSIQRTHEIGIRLALGAQPREILRMVLRQGMVIIAFGSGFGILMALGLARLVGHFLVGVSPTDPITYLGVSSFLVLVALTASYIPTRRATKIDPMVALRYE